MTYPHTIDERTSLITVILSNPREIEAVRRLRGDVAQSFVDLVDRVLSLSSILEEYVH